MTYRSRDYDITIAFPLRCELRQTCRYECNLVKNPSTRWRETKEKNRTRDQLIKNLLIQMGSWREKLVLCWRKDFEKKVVDIKPPDPRGVLGGKPMLYDWGLKGRGSRFRHETWKSKSRNLDESWLKLTCHHMQSRAMRLEISNVEVTQICPKTR